MVDVLLPVYVLVGGASRRFGRDKASFTLDGKPWAIDVAQRLAGGGSEITLVGSGPHPATLATTLAGFRRIEDATPGAGPLCAALTALEDAHQRAGDSLLVVAACDLVNPERAWLEPLVAAHRSSPIEVAAYWHGEIWRPFPLVVHTRWRHALRELVGEGVRSFQQALARSRAEAVPWPFAGAGPPQANTPQELSTLLGEQISEEK